MKTETTAKFLALNGQGMPRVYSDDQEDSASDCWNAVYAMAKGECALGCVMGSHLTLKADAEGWRDGVKITVC